MDTFTRAYIHAAAWTQDPNPGQGEYPAPDHAEIDPEFIANAIRDCRMFRAGLAAVVRVALEDRPGTAGHDFWLTRNGHGAGFWDGGWPEETGEALAAASKQFGEVHAQVFADGRDMGGE